VAVCLAATAPEGGATLQIGGAGGPTANPEVMARCKRCTTEAVELDDISLTRKRLELLRFDPVNVTDELVEVPPKNLRLRKQVLNPSFRKRRAKEE